MSEPLSQDERAAFSAEIDSILAVSDLKIVSAKRIRQSLQEGRDQQDILSKKSALNDLIQERFNQITAVQDAKTAVESGAPTNGASAHLPSSQPTVPSASASPVKHESELSELDDEGPPKKKAKKAKPKPVDDDAVYAARLQAELNNSGRPTRGGGAKPRASKLVVKKKARKKSSNKITAEDDSGVEDAGSDKEPTERGGAFNKPMYLSEPLKQLLGEETLSRPKTVKGIWKHVKEHDLQKPDDKRWIICDEPLKAVFKQDMVHMFTMNKILSKHLTPIED